jgi:CheY-like chemotaxis protein
MSARVLIVDDAGDYRWVIGQLLHDEPGIREMLEAEEGAAALEVAGASAPKTSPRGSQTYFMAASYFLMAKSASSKI